MLIFFRQQQLKQVDLKKSRNRRNIDNENQYNIQFFAFTRHGIGDVAVGL